MDRKKATPIQEKNIKEFMDTGLLTIINQILHVFGWSIVVEINNENDEPIRIYPARTIFRGFSETNQDAAYNKITKYMAKNSKKLLKEITE